MDEAGFNHFSIVTTGGSFAVKDKRTYAQMTLALAADGTLETTPVGGAYGQTATFFKANVVAIIGAK